MATHLWLEDSVRIAPDLADTLGRLRAITLKIKTLSEIEEKIPASLWQPASMRRGNPLRMIFRGLDRNDLRLLTTIVLCIRLGIRLPLFDEPNPYPFQIFKRAFGVPKEWQMPPGLFDVFPFAHKRILNALLKTTADQLEGARVVCRFLSHFLDNPKKWRRGAIVYGGAPLPWWPIKAAGLM